MLECNITLFTVCQFFFLKKYELCGIVFGFAGGVILFFP